MNTRKAFQHLISRALENGTDKVTGEAIEVARGAAQLAWAVLVLNAWGKSRITSYSVYPVTGSVVLRPVPRTDDNGSDIVSDNGEVPLVAAAKEVFPKLDTNVRARIGACP